MRAQENIVYSGIDALMLGCIDKVGKITYGQAIAEQNARLFGSDEETCPEPPIWD